ncbi:MAG: M28 family peptidase [Candidatus Krumholzibacteria bacterium]|nr:M28 family peptidase [Candidatus Krumholzibacteria bacterium]
MKSLSTLAAILAVWTTLGSLAVASPDSMPENIKAHAVALTDPVLAGRASGTPEAEAAADTLAAWMESLGLEPAFDGSWFQEIPLSGQGWAGEELGGKTGRNVAGFMRGNGNLAGRVVVVGAHYDHLGRVTPADGPAPPPAKGDYYPGANDNASGVSVVFELIRLAGENRDDSGDRRSVIFVNFVGEEVGLQGSGFMVSHLPVAVDSVDAMINFDTVGQLTGDRLYVSGVGTTPSFATMVSAANTEGLDLSLAQGGWSGSDHMSFNTKEIPVLFIFGGAYPEYNRPADDWPTLDFEVMATVAAYSSRLLRLIRDHSEELPWVMVSEKNLRQGESEGQNRDTWFGSLPDFTEEIVGYKLAGVFDGSPAAQAGLQKGDVLVMLGGDAIVDLPSFTQALRSHAPGDLVEVRVEREGRTLNFTVVLGNRADRE